MLGEIRQRLAKLAGVRGGKSMEAITVPSSAMGRKDSDELFTLRSQCSKQWRTSSLLLKGTPRCVEPWIQNPAGVCLLLAL